MEFTFYDPFKVASMASPLFSGSLKFIFDVTIKKEIASSLCYVEMLIPSFICA